MNKHEIKKFTEPNLFLSKDALNQPVGWSKEDNAPISLGDYIRAYSPKTAGEFNLSPLDNKRHIKKMCEQSEEELTELACYALAHGDKNVAAVIGGKSFSMEQLIHEIRKKTDVGLDQMRILKQHFAFLQNLVDAEKIHPAIKKIKKTFKYLIIYKDISIIL